MSEGKNKFYYKVYGLELESEIAIEELVLSTVNDYRKLNNKVAIKIKSMPKHIKEKIINNINGGYSNNEIWFNIKDIAIYRITNGNTIEFEPYEDADPYFLRVYLTCSCLGFIMLQKDIIAIHGGVIVINNKAIIITGDRGAGKSTLTTALRHRGYPFLSDDVAAITIANKLMVEHGFPYQKLCKNAMDNLGYDKDKYTSFMSDKEIKYLVPLKNEFIFNSVELGAICQITVDDIDDVEIEEVFGQKKLELIMSNRYRGEFTKAVGGLTPIAFKTILELAKKIKTYKIRRPKNGFTVDKQVELLEEKIKTLQNI